MADEGVFWVDEEEGYLVFKDEDSESKFMIEEEFTVDGQEYLVLIPADLKEDEEEEAIIMKVEKDNGEELISIIEDDEEFEKVKNAYLALLD